MGSLGSGFLLQTFPEGDREHFLGSAIPWEHDHGEEKLLVEERAGVSLRTPCCDGSQCNETKQGNSNSAHIPGISGISYLVREASVMAGADANDASLLV